MGDLSMTEIKFGEIKCFFSLVILCLKGLGLNSSGGIFNLKYEID